jgi:cephalosporin-C deacetylase
LVTSTQRDPEQYQVRVTRPPDFDDYWSELLASVASVPLDPTLDYDALRSTPGVEVYDIHYTSLDGVRISGWYCRPRETAGPPPPYPGLLVVPGYISDPVIPKSWARRGYAVLAVAPRGKVRSRSRVDARYPGLLIENSVDRNTYGYRAFFIDACRAVDFMLSRPEVDRQRLGVHGSSQGGALTCVLAALRRDVIACGAAGAPYLCAYLDAAALTRSYPYHEITEHLRLYPEQAPAMEAAFAYFDVINFAPLIEAPMLVYIGLADDVCPPETGYALVRAMHCPKQLIATARCAHDAGAHWVGREVDRFLAQHLAPGADQRTEVPA